MLNRILREAVNLQYIFQYLREQMAQPTLPIPSGAAKISCFDRINGQKNDIRLRIVDFFSSETFSYVALVCDGSRKSKRNRRRRMAATGENMAKPPILTPDRRFLACQYVNILPILRERLANIQDQYLQSLKSIILETFTENAGLLKLRVIAIYVRLILWTGKRKRGRNWQMGKCTVSVTALF